MGQENTEQAAPERHSVSSAAKVIEGLLSEKEDGETRETPEPAAANAQVEGEDAPEVEEGAEEVEQQPAHDDESDEAVEASADEPVQPRKVKVNDEIGEVTEEELVKGFLRQQDYTRKTQTVAEEKKKFSVEADAVRAERAEIATRLTALREALEQSTTQEPNWEAIQQEMEPGEFAATWARWDQHKKRIEAVKAHEREAHEKVQQDRVKQFSQHIESEQVKLIEAIPEWKNAEVAKAEKQSLVQYATETIGFSEADLASVADHRVLVLLRNAYLHDKAQKARPKAQEKIEKVKVAAPGTPQKREAPVVAEVTRRKQRLAKTGRVSDAAAVFESMFD